MRRIKTLTVYTVILMTWSVSVASGDGRPVPKRQLPDSAMLALAQAIVGEASFRRSDRAPIAWVLAKRWRRVHERHPFITFERMVRSYASPMKRKTHWVRQLPWGPVGGRYSERWADVRRFVREWGEGQHKDPCPTAIHWGAPYGVDLKRATEAGWLKVDCGDTANVFWRLGR